MVATQNPISNRRASCGRTAESPPGSGPDAVQVVTRALRASRLWALDDPSLKSAGAAWLALRLAQLAEYTLEISVGHRDMLVLPRQQAFAFE